VIGEFVFHESRVFRAALDGDETALRDAAGPDGHYALAPGQRAALLVFTGPDGHQQGNTYRPGTVSRLEIPRGFRVRDVRHTDGRFVLTGADGTVVHGTAGQFGRCPQLIDEPDNPAYQEQVAENFRDTHLLPDPDADPGSCPPLHDPVLGAIVHPGDDGHYTATADRDGEPVTVTFDSAGPDRVTALLPHARRLAGDVTGVHDRARDLIWAFGVHDEQPGERAQFDAATRAVYLTVFRTGDFELGVEDDGSYLPDGYWLTVTYRADLTPVAVNLICS
jgi:hypothetical protein